MREQIQRLNKTPGTEVQAGVLQSGTTQTSKMGYVQQQKTSGQRMAETFGMLVDTGTKLATKGVELYKGQLDEEAVNQFNQDKFRFIEELSQQGSNADKALYLNNKMKELSDSGVNTKYRDAFINTFSGAYKTALDGVYTEGQNFKKGQLANEFAVKVAEGNLDYDNTVGKFSGLLDKKYNHETLVTALTSQLGLEATLVTSEQGLKEFDSKVTNLMVQYNKIPFAGASKSTEAIDLQTKLNKAMSTIRSNITTNLKSVAKDKLDYLQALNSDPVVVDKHLKTMKDNAYINELEFKTQSLNWAEKWSKENLSTINTQLTNKEKALAASLENAGSSVYLNKEEEAVYSRYVKVIDDKVKTDKNYSYEEGEKAKLKMYQEIKDNRELVTVKTDWDILDAGNEQKYATGNSKVRDFIKSSVLGKLSDDNTPFEEKVKIANNNYSIAKSTVSSWIPFTTDINKIEEGRVNIEKLKKTPGGKHLYNKLPTKARVLYDTLNAIDVLPGADPQVTLQEVERIDSMIASIGNLDDYGIKMKDRIKTNETLNKSLRNLPDPLQQQIMFTYDYLTQSMDAKSAANYIRKEVAPRYITTLSNPGTFSFSGNRPDKVHLVGFHNSPYVGLIDNNSDKLVDAIMNISSINTGDAELSIAFDEENSLIDITTKPKAAGVFSDSISLIKKTIKAKDLCRELNFKNCK